MRAGLGRCDQNFKRSDKYQRFENYRDEFLSLYSGRAIIDPLGNTVEFDPTKCEEYCLHVCYGGTAAHWNDPQHWKQERAERIGWIERAIAAHNKIHPDKDFQDQPKRIKYLLYLPPDNDGDENEFYCVIAEFVSAKRLVMVTAYDIDREQYRGYAAVAPCLYPVKEKKAKRKKG